MDTSHLMHLQYHHHGATSSRITNRRRIAIASYLQPQQHDAELWPNNRR